MGIATLDLTPDLFIEFCKACGDGGGLGRRFVVRQNALPDDAEVKRVDYMLRPSSIRLTIGSAEFEEVSEGVEPLKLPPIVFDTLYDTCRSPTIALIDKKIDEGISGLGALEFARELRREIIDGDSMLLAWHGTQDPKDIANDPVGILP